MFGRGKKEKGASVSPAEATSKAERVRIFQEFLRKEGYVPEIDSDGDIVFKREGRTYLIFLSDKDDEFFRIAFPGFWKIESEEERARVERAALRATANTKVAKVFPVGENTWATIELFCESIEAAKPVFARSMNALQHAVSEFVKEMRE